MAGMTPRALAVQVALMAGATSIAATAVASDQTHLHLKLVFGCLVGIVSFFLVYRQIGLYIEDRVRVIYKTIRRLKGSTSHVHLDMGRDIVEQVNQDVMTWADSQIEEITALREADTFRKEFIGNLAHELKTPIFNIQGFILTLLEGGLNDPEINRKFLLKAAKNVDRMTRLLEDLDVITKMESGTLDIELVPFDLLETVRETMESIEPKAKRSEIDLRLKKGFEASQITVSYTHLTLPTKA